MSCLNCTSACNQGRDCPERRASPLGTVASAVAAVAIIAVWMAMAAQFDSERFEADQADAATVATQQRRDAAALKICGPGAAPAWQDDSTLVCRQHNGKGKATTVAGVTP